MNSSDLVLILENLNRLVENTDRIACAVESIAAFEATELDPEGGGDES